MASQSILHPLRPVVSFFTVNSFGRDLLNCFRSVQLAIVLLSLLAIGTIIGTVMPQEGMVELADIQKHYGTNFQFLYTMGFFNVFSSFWFITLQVLFFFNLLIGSFKWLKPATQAAFLKTTLPPELLLIKPQVHSLSQLVSATPEALSQTIRPLLKRFHYQVHADSEGNLYASKGNITRLGPCIAHLGILLCLIAGVYSSFTGFKAVRMAIPGETFGIMEANTFKTNTPAPYWQGSVPNWKIHVKDFNIEFYKDHPETAKQYVSDIDIISPDGHLIKSQSISVNHPLIYDHLTIYQSSFAPTGRFLLTVNGQPVVAQLNSQFNQRPISLSRLHDGSTLIMFPFIAGQDPGVRENFGVFFIRKPGQAFGGNGHMPQNIRLKQGMSGQLNGYNVTFRKPEMSTGLQIKRALEVPLMYASYLIIMLGAILCFFSQRQIWIAFNPIASQKTEILLYPKTNKAWLSFRKELTDFETALSQAVRNTAAP